MVYKLTLKAKLLIMPRRLIDSKATPSFHTLVQYGSGTVNFATTKDVAAAIPYTITKMQFVPITEKPNERHCPSPVVPAYANFKLARRMHQDNLDHQPLPDCVTDAAFRRMQITGAHSGLALDIDPVATGVGIKMLNAGPTHCTKMKVFRPRSTCGVVPKSYATNTCRDTYLTTSPSKKMSAMDLAIGWDFQPTHPSNELLRPAHIDGSQETAGPAVFNYVKSPRTDTTQPSAGRAAGVFASTLGETEFFDKDILQRNTEFSGRNTSEEDNCACGDGILPLRAISSERHINVPARLGKQYQSSPNLTSDQAYKQLRDKYLSSNTNNCRVQAMCEPACKRGFIQRVRAGHKVAPTAQCTDTCCRLDTQMTAPSRCKPTAFRSGLPRYDAGGNMVSSDSNCCGFNNHAHRVLVVPLPKIPYAKRNYDIDTLVPPFSSSAGRVNGYPEHWRLASVYQHAYNKPPQLRRRPLLQTVYK